MMLKKKVVEQWWRREEELSEAVKKQPHYKMKFRAKISSLAQERNLLCALRSCSFLCCETVHLLSCCALFQQCVLAYLLYSFNMCFYVRVMAAQHMERFQRSSWTPDRELLFFFQEMKMEKTSRR